MNWYKVLVASNRYHGDDALTYSSDLKLKVGQIVSVPLQNQAVVGVVSGIIKAKPDFATKPIDTVVTDALLPAELVSLIGWLGEYYPAPLGTLMQMILPRTLLQT